MMCCVAYISCQRTEQSASSRQLIYAPAYLEHTGAKGSKLLVHSRRHVCQRKPNEWKEVNDILILTNITLAAAGAGVCDYCRSRLAIAGYRNRLRKDKDGYISIQRTTHPSAKFFTEIFGKSDDMVGRGIVFTTGTKARSKKGSLQAKRSASCVRNDE